jgi:cyclopropane fatty-acyl-phospholipid synthase-like methyltransferase
MDQQAFYERLASGSKAVRDESAALVKRDQFVINDIRRNIGDDRPIRIAELSIGDGRMTMAICAALPNARLSCAEISEGRLNHVRQLIDADLALAARPPTFIQCNFDTEFDRLPTNAFDAVIALDIMEHVLDVFGFMNHCRRISKQAGRLYLRVPNIAYVRHRLRILLGRIPITASWFETPGELTAWRLKHGWDGGHLHLFTVPILRKLFDESGFHVENSCDPGTKMAALRTLWPSLMFANPLIVARKK